MIYDFYIIVSLSSCSTFKLICIGIQCREEILLLCLSAFVTSNVRLYCFLMWKQEANITSFKKTRVLTFDAYLPQKQTNTWLKNQNKNYLNNSKRARNFYQVTRQVGGGTQQAEGKGALTNIEGGIRVLCYGTNITSPQTIRLL